MSWQDDWAAHRLMAWENHGYCFRGGVEGERTKKIIAVIMCEICVFVLWISASGIARENGVITVFFFLKKRRTRCALRGERLPWL